MIVKPRNFFMRKFRVAFFQYHFALGSVFHRSPVAYDTDLFEADLRIVAYWSVRRPRPTAMKNGFPNPSCCSLAKFLASRTGI